MGWNMRKTVRRGKSTYQARRRAHFPIGKLLEQHNKEGTLFFRQKFGFAFKLVEGKVWRFRRLWAIFCDTPDDEHNSCSEPIANASICSCKRTLWIWLFDLEEPFSGGLFMAWFFTSYSCCVAGLLQQNSFHSSAVE